MKEAIVEIERIKKSINELRLSGIHESLDRRIAEALADNLSYEVFLSLLIEDERQSRKNKIAKKLDTLAQFRRESYFENWDSGIDRGLSKQKVRELSTVGFFQEKKNLIILGPTGCGKTHLSIAIGKSACQLQLSVLFTSLNQLFEDALSHRVSGKYATWSKKTKNIDIIIFDDFGLRTYTHDEAIILLDLIEDRYQKKVHIFSSQVEVEGWKTLFEDPVIADAIVDRIKNPSEKIKMTGGSYRERIGK